MLRKRSRSVQRDQYTSHLMPDSALESCFQAEVLGQKPKNSSFFSVPGQFVGFTTKILSDSDSVSSPTSPLDYRVFSRSPRSSSSDRSQKSWDCSKVGLSIIDSLSDETKQSGKILSESKNILFGSQMKINIPDPRIHFYGLNDSSATPKSLPKNYAVSLNGLLKSPRLQVSSPEIVPEDEESHLEPNSFGKIQSFLSNPSISASNLTHLTRHNPNSSSEDFWLDKNKITVCSESPPLTSRDANINNSLGMKSSSLSMSVGSANGFLGSLSASEIELSEDYTCVISHGPNPRTTHIYGDCILECHTNEFPNCCKKEEQGIQLPPSVNCSNRSAPYSVDDFLSYCFSCKKKLEEGKDIYIYRGEKAFCSCDCRSEEILVEEEMEKTMNNSFEDSRNSP